MPRTSVDYGLHRATDVLHTLPLRKRRSFSCDLRRTIRQRGFADRSLAIVARRHSAVTTARRGYCTTTPVPHLSANAVSRNLLCELCALCVRPRSVHFQFAPLRYAGP